MQQDNIKHLGEEIDKIQRRCKCKPNTRWRHKKLKVHQFNQSARLEFSEKSHENHRQSIHLFYFCELPILTTILFIHSIGWQVFRIGYRPPITLLCFSKNSGWCKKGPLFTWLQSTSNQTFDILFLFFRMADFPTDKRPLYAPFFSVMGASSAMIFR